MNDILLLNETEKEDLCKMIGGKSLKELFRYKNEEFAKIKPGFRSQTLNDSKAISLAIKYIDKPFIIEFLNEQVEEELKKINDSICCLRSDMTGMEEEEVLALALSDSCFSNNSSLYFRLREEKADICYIQDVQNKIKEIQSSDVKDQKKHLSTDMPGTDKIEKLPESMMQFKNIPKEIQVQDFKEYDETDKRDIDILEFNHRSICEVREKHLERLADVNKDGSLEKFSCDTNIAKSSNNRNKLYDKENPHKLGFVGVWDWYTIPDTTDPLRKRERVKAQFNEEIIPIEVTIFEECNEIIEVIEKIKIGILINPTTPKVLISTYLEKENLVGLLCSDSDLESTKSGVRLKGNITSLPKYVFKQNDIIYLSNKKNYLKNVKIEQSPEMVRIKNPLEIVKSVILSKMSWPVFKKKGMTKNEWRIVRGFFECIDTVSITKEIADACKCSEKDAGVFLENFLENVGEYIDGKSIENRVIAAVISVNDDLKNQCKDLLYSEWKEENQSNLNDAQKQLDDINQKYDLIKSDLQKKIKEGEERISKLQEEYSVLQSKHLNILEKIEEQKQLALDVEEQVSERIHNAQSNVAEFIAKMSFIPHFVHLEDAKESISNTLSESNYTAGMSLDIEDVDDNDSWEDLLDTITNGLIDAGVSRRMARPFAGYIYSAYLNKVPLLIVGPNAYEIADVFSAALFGKKAGTLECNGEYDAVSISNCKEGKDSIVKILNIFNTNWIARLPELLNTRNIYFLGIYPFVEDMQIEPKSLYNYMLPVHTNLFIDHMQTEDFIGGIKSDKFIEFNLSDVKNSGKWTHTMKILRVNDLIKSNMQKILYNMHEMIDDFNMDYDVIFTFLPYAISTMQIIPFWEFLQNDVSLKAEISKKVLKLVDELYGEKK